MSVPKKEPGRPFPVAFAANFGGDDSGHPSSVPSPNVFTPEQLPFPNGGRDGKLPNCEQTRLPPDSARACAAPGGVYGAWLQTR